MNAQTGQVEYQLGTCPVIRLIQELTGRLPFGVTLTRPKLFTAHAHSILGLVIDRRGCGVSE